MRSLTTVAALLLACGSPQTSAPPAVVDDAPAPSGALYDWARPTAARLHLEVDPERESFEGRVELDVELERATRVVWLHADGLVVTSARITSKLGRQRATATAEASGELMAVRVDSPLAAGKVTLELSYRGTLRSDVGLFRKRIAGHWYLYSDFQPIDARRAFPCFDEPRWRLPWSVTVSIPQGLGVFGNMPERQRRRRGERVEVSFETTPELPSYLIAVAAGPFDVVEGARKPVELRAIVPKGKARLAKRALALMPRYIEALAEYTQMAPRVEKLDLVAVPDLNGAMENHGLFTFNDDILLVPEGSALPRQQLLHMVLAHEASHLWFGNLVGFRRWEDLWLSEGFATLMADWAGMKLHPEESIATRQVLYMRDAMEVDRRPQVRTMTSLTRSDRPAEQAFDPLSYKKGGALLGMAAKHLGERRFRQRVRSFLAKNRGRSVSQEALARALAKGDERVAATM
ncbi:MAG: M1 family metallopeptidase, partial [Deltaproteobacteria bacterium]|nr:M1 family metallopeptidase [Deltaproteobacteria bacterium]